MARKMKDSGVEWIGMIPENWGTPKIVNQFDIIGSGTTPKSNEDGYYEDGTIYWIQSGDLHNRFLESTNKKITQEAFDNASALKLYEPEYLVMAMYGASIGNVSISKIRACTNQACCVLANSRNYLKYMYYVISSAKDYLIYLAVGGTQPNISQNIVRDLRTPLPNLEEQRKIADFLDGKIGEVDTIISKTKESIEEYKKYKKSIVIKAVTKGLHPNVPMKQTDSDWIGEIPAHWEYVRIQRLFETVDERNEDENALLLSLYTALGVKPRNELEEKGNKASTVINYKKVQKNDIIVNKLLAWMGAIGYSDYEGVTSPDYDVYRAREGANIVRNYYNEYFRNTCFNGDCYKYGHGIMLMRWRTYPEEFLRIKVPNPPLEEQQEIAEYLAEKCGEIDALIAKKEAFVEEMEAYKKSLIYEYVTGKKEVL